MTFAMADLAPLLQPAVGAAMRYASGIIQAWNPDTFENVIEVSGAQWVNLPVLAGTDALTYKEGDVVGLVGADPSGRRGVTSYAIIGRFVIPGAGQAEAAVDWMTSELGRQISGDVFADRVKWDNKTFLIKTTADSVWQEGVLDGSGTPDPGPIVETDITDRGMAIVLFGASVQGGGNTAATMSFDITGATTHSPLDVQDPVFHSTSATNLQDSLTSVEIVSNLNKGVNKFQAKYRSLTLGGTAKWGNRFMVVIGF